MWRSLSVLEGDLVCFLDADVLEFSTRYPIGLLAPLVELDEVSFVKAHYRRPFRHGDAVVPDGGGRVNHLLARPFGRLGMPSLSVIFVCDRRRSLRAVWTPPCRCDSL